MTDDARQFAPSAERNSSPIGDVLALHLPDVGTVLELGSGTGQHAVCFAERFPALTWQPSDPSLTARESIAAWTTFTPRSNLLAPIDLDCARSGWSRDARRALAEAPPVRFVYSANMIHIAAWSACEGLFAGAGALVESAGRIMLYGPFAIDGRHVAPSNAAFDQMLRARDPDSGVRDLTEVTRVAASAGFALEARVEMPANNFCVIFGRAS